MGKLGCIDVSKEAIKLIRDHIQDGFMCSIRPADFAAHVRVSHLTGQAYSFTATSCLAGVHNWADKRHFDGEIAYFFENGHKHQGEANELLNKMVQQPILRERFRYVSHTFADKRRVRLLQVADVIAWHWFKEQKRIIEGKRPNMRADTAALMGPNQRGVEFKALDYDADSLRFTMRSAYRHLIKNAFSSKKIYEKLIRKVRVCKG